VPTVGVIGTNFVGATKVPYVVSVAKPATSSGVIGDIYCSFVLAGAR
jgi:hypothetical protein